MMVCEWRIGRYVQRTGRGLFKVLAQNSSRATEENAKHENIRQDASHRAESHRPYLQNMKQDW